MEEGGLCSSFAAAMVQGQAQQQHTFCPVLGGPEIRGSQGFNSEALTQAVQHVERLLKGAPESVMGTVQYIGQNARMCASMPIPNYRTEQVPVPPPPPPLPPIQSALTVGGSNQQEARQILMMKRFRDVAHIRTAFNEYFDRYYPGHSGLHIQHTSGGELSVICASCKPTRGKGAGRNSATAHNDRSCHLKINFRKHKAKEPVEDTHDEAGSACSDHDKQYYQIAQPYTRNGISNQPVWEHSETCVAFGRRANPLTKQAFQSHPAVRDLLDAASSPSKVTMKAAVQAVQVCCLWKCL
jgi:hypothetical protein